jgi:hypothetical protein
MVLFQKNVMPGFSFPTLGPVGVGPPASQSKLSSDPRYYDPLRLPKAHLDGVRYSLSPTDTLPVRFVSYLQRSAWTRPRGGTASSNAWDALSAAIP